VLHSKIYNQGISQEMKTAFSKRDRAFFHGKIFHLSAEIVQGPTAPQELYSELHLCLALLDSIENAGETVSLVTDFINL